MITRKCKVCGEIMETEVADVRDDEFYLIHKCPNPKCNREVEEIYKIKYI